MTDEERKQLELIVSIISELDHNSVYFTLDDEHALVRAINVINRAYNNHVFQKAWKQHANK